MKYYVIYISYGEVASFDILEDQGTAFDIGEAICKKAGIKSPMWESSGGTFKVVAKGKGCSVTIIAREG